MNFKNLLCCWFVITSTVAFQTAALGQTALNSPGANWRSWNEDALLNELTELRQEVAAYKRLPYDQQQEWVERIEVAYPAARVTPLENQTVLWLYALIEDKELANENLLLYWKVSHEVYITLMYICPADPRLAEAAKKILSADLPDVISYIPVQNLIQGCLATLLKQSGKDYHAYFLLTETPGFWEERAGTSTLEEDNIFKDDPEATLLTLRAKAVIAYLNVAPDEAKPFLMEIVQRPSENPRYKQFAQGVLTSLEEPDPYPRAIP